MMTTTASWRGGASARLLLIGGGSWQRPDGFSGDHGSGTAAHAIYAVLALYVWADGQGISPPSCG
jgi:hypothetical protein